LFGPTWLTTAVLFGALSLTISESRAQTPLYRMQEGKASEVYWSNVRMEPNAKTKAVQVDGQGVITRLWCTILPKDGAKNDFLGRALVLNLYWDGAEKPAVSAPLADFFCQPLHLQSIENRFFSASNNLCVFNCVIPMPFRKGFRLEVENGTTEKLSFWYGIDVERRPIEASDLYLHTYWNRRERTTAEEEIVVLPQVAGRGRYLGTHWALRQPAPDATWRWYSRNVQVRLDAGRATDAPGILVGTLDDFVCSGWWSLEKQRQAYAAPFTGRPLVTTERDGSLSIAFYRYHVEDPLWFHRSVAVTVGKYVQHSREELPKLADGDWSTTSFFYLDKPTSSLPPIPDAKVRTSGY
jgi:hypothetical protein